MDQKQILHRYLDKQRKALVAKLDGIGERDVRWPMTQTGTNLLGLVKHVASIELGYFGEVFDRPLNVPLPWFDEGAEINADMWATAEESRTDIVSLYEQAAVHADATVEALSLDSRGRVPWWPPDREQVTLQQIMVHVTAEIARHAGHADIIRELIDGVAGDNDGNVPDQTAQEWASYRLRLEEAAAEAARRAEAHDPRRPRIYY
ncbi:MAG TPA: DinB family protein [Propionibacteriaceae bacterium]|nr:DinB family protein [Propionibacteriaceae bacterium]